MPVNCALWLNKHKIYSAVEIADNLDIAALRGYFLAGSLVEWLGENGGAEYAKKLSRISPDDSRLNEKLAEVFGGKPLPAKSFGNTDGALQNGADNKNGVSSANGFAFGSAGSFGAYNSLIAFGSAREMLQNLQGSYAHGSFTFGSYRYLERLFELFSGSFGSFYFGSFSQYEWEWLFRFWAGGYGSFGSFSFGSFSRYEWEWLFRFLTGGYGSFGSFAFGSFSFWEMLRRFGSFRGQGFGSFPSSLGSFAPSAVFGAFDENALAGLDEYDRIMFGTLMICPLDKFGYGIHNI